MAASSSSNNIPTLDLETGESDYQKFIEAILDICWPVYRQKRKGEEVKLKDLRRTGGSYEELSGENWVFQVRLSYKGIVLDVLMQKLDLYIVGYKGKDEQWILLQGRFPKLVLKALKHQHGEMIQTREPELGTSYTSLFGNYSPTFKNEVQEEVRAEEEELRAEQLLWGGIDVKKLKKEIGAKKVREETKKLKLNREALIRAVRDLKEKPFEKRESAGHVIILIQMICEAVRFKPIADHISQSYLLKEPTKLSDHMIGMQHFWTKGSREIKDWAEKPKYKKCKDLLLGGTKLTIDEVLQDFSCIKAITDEETLKE